MIFCCHANKTHFHNKGFTIGLVLKVRVSGTRKWPFIGKTFSDQHELREQACLFQVYTLMKFDSYPRFLKSDVYRQSLAADLEGAPLPGEEGEEDRELKTRGSFFWKVRSRGRVQTNHKGAGGTLAIPTLLAIRVPVAQRLEHPNLNLEGSEFDSHLKLGNFSELSGIWVFLLL